MKPIVFSLVLSFFAYACTIGQPLKGTVKGQVVDTTASPLPFAAVSLLEENSQKVRANSLTDEQGYFVFSNVDAGKYRIVVTLLGFMPQPIGPFTVDDAQPLVQVGQARLVPQTVSLAEVTVTSQKPLIEMEKDKIIYNAENDVNRDSYTAAELLRNVPMVNVDATGNITLKGSSNFIVYLNGKSTSVLALNPKEALKAFPASIIKKIEVITSPSAKYEGTGVAGIINIITATKYKGFNGNASLGAMSLGTLNGTVAMNSRVGKLGIAGYAGATRYDYIATIAMRQENNLPHGGQRILQRKNVNRLYGRNLVGNLELSYDLDSLNTLSLYGNYMRNSNNTFSNQSNLFFDSEHLNGEGELRSDNRNNNESYDAGFDYQKKYKKPGRYLSLSLFSSSNATRDNTDNQQNNPLPPDQYYRNYNKRNTHENTVQLDYNHPFSRRVQAEFGLKSIFRAIESNYSKVIRESDGAYSVDEDQTDLFRFKQNVFGVYNVLHLQLAKNLRSSLGGRLEFSQNRYGFKSDEAVANDQFLNFIPSFNLTLEVKEEHSLAVNYNRRLQRPWIDYLNPFVNDNDPYNVFYGNIALTPELYHNFNLTYSGAVNGLKYTTELGHMTTSNSIESYTRLDSATAVVYNTYYNIGNRAATTLSVSTSVSISHHWDLSSNFQVLYTNLENQQDRRIHNAGLSANGSMRSSLTVAKGLRVETSLAFFTPYPTLQGRSSGWITYNISLRKEILKGKATVTLGADRIFQRENIYRDWVRTENLYQYSDYRTLARAFRIGLNWNYGKLKESVTRKKGVSNEDLKVGGKK